MATHDHHYLDPGEKPPKVTLYVVLIILIFLLLCWVIWLFFDYKIRTAMPVAGLPIIMPAFAV